MGTSPYKRQLEDFKKALPEKLLEHAAKNGLELCDEGLADFFNDIGVEWKSPREDTMVTINFRIALPVKRNSWGGNDVHEDGEAEVDDLLYKVEKLLCKESDSYQSGSISLEELYVWS